MKNEMDLMNMDERQRLAWFMANRGTLIAVGAVWIGMIGWELTHGRVPAFLLIMVPVFALFRAGLYVLYSSRPFAGSDSRRGPRLVRYGKGVAALLLVAAALLPIYSVEGAPGEAAVHTYAWELVLEEPAVLLPLLFAYLWPTLVLGLSRLRSRSGLQVMLQFAEPVLAVVSSIIMLWIPQLILETRIVFFIPVVIEPTPQWGCYLAVAANGLYMVSWLAGLLRPWPVQET
jgi:hypothetical protein